MAKLKLNLDALNVETFQTADAGAEEGTVHGQQITPAGSCGCWYTVATCPATCQITCGATCYPTCRYTCRCYITQFPTCGQRTCWACRDWP